MATKNIISHFFRRINVQTHVRKSPRRKAQSPRLTQATASESRSILVNAGGKTHILEVRS